MATTNLGKVAVVPKGEYSSAVQYERLDIVQYERSSYLVKQAVIGVTPTDGAIYALLAGKGDSSYEVAVNNGFIGTEEDWKLYLKSDGSIQALQQFMTNDASTEVSVPDYGNIPSLQGYISTMFENGGLPATQFDTYTQMLTSDLAVGAMAVVTYDPNLAANGYYKKTATGWKYQNINSNQRLMAVEDKDAVISYEEITESIPYTLTTGHIAPVPRLVDGTVGYAYSSVFTVKAGEILEYTGKGNGVVAVLDVAANKAVHYLGVTPPEYFYESVYMTEVSLVDKTYRVSGLRSALKCRIVKPIRESGLVSKVASFLTRPEIVERSGNGIFTNGKRMTLLLEGWHIVGVSLNQGDILQCDKVYLNTFYIEDIVDDAFPYDLPYRFPVPVTLEGYKAEYTCKVWFSLPVNKKVYVNGQLRETPVAETGVYWESKRELALANYTRTLDAVRVLQGDRFTFTSPSAGVILVAFKSNEDSDFHNALGTLYRNNTYVSPDLEWVAPEDGWVHVCSHKDSPVLHYSKANPLPAESLTDYVDKQVRESSNNNVVPDNLTLPAREYVFATAMNYILKTEIIDGTDYIKISQDLGKTWTQIPNILGDIVSYHFFSDGTIMLCSPQKVYWTNDYLTLNEATVYDHDGSVFVPTSRHFFAMQTGDKLDFVGDTEIYAWGDYHVDGTPARIWYTTDNGRTIKCSARFGVTNMGGVVRSIRHIHRVYYHQKSDYWYVTTGDSGNECMIIRGRFTPSTDTWAWEVLNSGIYYKFGNIMIDDDNMAFMITDYTEASQSEEKGIYRVHASNLGDFSKYRMIYKAEPSEWGAIAPVSLLLDPNGSKVILPDYLGAGYIWVASEGLDFKRVTVSPNILLAYTIGENYKGDIYCVAYEGGNNLRLNSGSYNLTKALRNAGMSNFMRGSTLISGLKTVVS